MELDKLPFNICFIGGGYISFEFAHVAARAGSKVTILHHGKKALKNFDADLVGMLLKKTREINIEVKLQTMVEKVELIDKDKNFLVYSSVIDDNGNSHKSSVIEADMVVHGGGRVPDVEDLKLESAGVEYDKKDGIKVNEYLQSISNPAIYAAGDVAATGRHALNTSGCI